MPNTTVSQLCHSYTLRLQTIFPSLTIIETHPVSFERICQWPISLLITQFESQAASKAELPQGRVFSKVNWAVPAPIIIATGSPGSR